MCKIIDVNTSDKFLWSSHVTALTPSIIITAFHLNLCLIEETPAASLICHSSLCLLVSLHTSVIYLLQQLLNSCQFWKKKFRCTQPKSPYLLTVWQQFSSYFTITCWHIQMYSYITGSFPLLLLWGLPCSLQHRADSWISRSIPLLL